MKNLVELVLCGENDNVLELGIPNPGGSFAFSLGRVILKQAVVSVKNPEFMGARVKDRSKGDIYSFAEENKPEGANAYWAATLNPYLYEHEKVIFYWHIDEEQAEKALSAEE